MDPVTLSLIAASVGGGLLGMHQKKPQGIDPNWLKEHFGANAVNDEMIKLYNNIIASPYGQQLLTNAAQQGQQFQTDEARAAANAGFGPTGGASSGASIFSGAAAGGATNALQRGAKSDVMQAAMPVAQNIVQSQMQLAGQGELQRLQMANSQPSTMQMLGGALTSGANTALSAYSPQGPTEDMGRGSPAGSYQVNPRLPINSMNAEESAMGNNPIFAPRRGFWSRLLSFGRRGPSRLVMNNSAAPMESNIQPRGARFQ